MEPDLELVTTDDLLTELMKRYDHCIFAGLNPVNFDSTRVRLRWKGNHATCAGLGQHASIRCVTDYIENGQDDVEPT